jgi:hypothetical protein
MELPAGTYEVGYEEHETVFGGHVIWQLMRCSIPIPPDSPRPGLLGGNARIDPRELERVYEEDHGKPT